VSEPGGVVVQTQTEGGDPEPVVDVMRRGRDVVLGESISAETGVIQRPAPPTPKITIARRFTVSPERFTGIVLYLGLERKNSNDAGHPQYHSTTKHITWEVCHDTGDCSRFEYRRSRRHLGISRARALERFRPHVGGLHWLGVLLPQRRQQQCTRWWDAAIPSDRFAASSNGTCG